MLYKKVFFEISGLCQARCPHCCTGNKSLKAYQSRYIPVDEFASSVERLTTLGLVGRETQFELYNWGEPFLHPNLLDILRILVNFDFKYRLSTNAGKYLHLPKDLTRNMNQLTITIPGFSQKSYDLVHGLNFQKILSNINHFSDDIGVAKLRITFLLHQFNIGEISEAHNYFSNNKIMLTCTVAYMNDYNLCRDYLMGALSYEKLKKLGQELILNYVEDLILSRPRDYICPQYSILALDEFCNVLTCCAVPKGHPDYTLGPLAELSAEDIVREKGKKLICQECQSLGIDYWNHTSAKPKYWGQLTGETLRISYLASMIDRKVRSQIKRMIFQS